MSMARRAAVAAGAFTLTAATVATAATAVSASTATSASPSAGHSGQASQVLKPGILHARHATSQPPTTADCETAYQIACYEPGQIQTAYNLAPLFHHGVTGRGQTLSLIHI